MKHTVKAASVQEETKACLGSLGTAYQTYMFKSAIATENYLTDISKAMTKSMMSSQLRVDPDSREPDQVPRLAVQSIRFTKEINRTVKRGYILREHQGELVDLVGPRRAVIVRKFEMTEDCEQTRVDFTEELELRRNMLHESIARLIGFSVASDRTRMIVVETGTIVAYAYLQSLPIDVRLYECIRIMNECSAGYMFLYDHKVSWKSRLNNVVLDARDKQLRIGALGEFDSYWNDSNQRMESVTTQLVAGRDGIWSGIWSFQQCVQQCASQLHLLNKWKSEKTPSARRALLGVIWWRSVGERFGSETVEKEAIAIGDIGWFDGPDNTVWRRASVATEIPLSSFPSYHIIAQRLRADDCDFITGVQIGRFIRWSFDYLPGETVTIQTQLRRCTTPDFEAFFLRSASKIARQAGVDPRSLRLVSSLGVQTTASVTLATTVTTYDFPRTIYYFATVPQSDSPPPDPPGFWSFSSEPAAPDDKDDAPSGIANQHFTQESYGIRFSINEMVLSLLEDIDLETGVPVPDLAPGPARPDSLRSQALERYSRLTSHLSYVSKKRRWRKSTLNVTSP
ncbi:hypothetical protein SISNIDRAFT_178940 [Sistotremastrum niveocremeum HHB9708]|uniref:Protein kinase domain-containing protein n=1 Tax=Sistotremastrum niveocremeum HHB9708 TaxID=1314777 RepID=A0A164RAA1_9AGAM|nr:hypothetical protein SISNIDRAFT_178940 [Sistotremastrum niveocremeum HHB9708]